MQYHIYSSWQKIWPSLVAPQIYKLKQIKHKARELDNKWEKRARE